MPIHASEKYCAKCRRPLRVIKNGVKVCHTDELHAFAEGDLWKCDGCGIEIIMGFGAYHRTEAITKVDYYVSG